MGGFKRVLYKRKDKSGFVKRNKLVKLNDLGPQRLLRQLQREDIVQIAGRRLAPKLSTCVAQRSYVQKRIQVRIWKKGTSLSNQIWPRTTKVFKTIVNGRYGAALPGWLSTWVISKSSVQKKRQIRIWKREQVSRTEYD